MAKSCDCKYFVCEHLDDGWTPMPDKTIIILRNDPAKKRKKLGKVKDLFEQMEKEYNEFEHYINSIIKNKGGEIKHNA